MTKNLLLSSTALVGAIAMATPALADIEVTLSGQVEFGAQFFDKETVGTRIDNGDGTTSPSDGRGYLFFMDSETKIQAEGAADNGINYSGKVELETDADIQNVNADETVIAFWGGFGRAELGREDGASDSMHVGGENFQAGTGGIDGDTGNLSLPQNGDSGDAAKITYYTPRIAGFQLGASYLPDTSDNELDDDNQAGEFEDFFELGANFTTAFGGADVTVTGTAALGGAQVGTEEDRRDYAIGLGVEFAGFGVGAGYVIQDKADKSNGFTLGASYGFGPANVSVGFSRDDPDNFTVNGVESNEEATNVYAVSADYGLLPGVTLKGDITHNDNDRDLAIRNGDNVLTDITGRDSTTAFVATIQLDY